MAAGAGQTWQDRVAKRLAKSDPRLSIAIRAHLSGDPCIADVVCRAKGLDHRSLVTAARMLEAEPAALEREQREVAAILTDCMAVHVEFDDVCVSRRISDISEAERLERVWRAGWVAGVLGRDLDLSLTVEQAVVWREGQAAFVAAYEAFLKSESEVAA